MNANFLNEDGSPNINELITMFNRCGPTVSAGLTWLDNTRFCRWPNQFTDGRKHDVGTELEGAAIPYDGASDCRPFVVDDIVNERVAMKATAFWHARQNPGSSGTDEGSYAVALLEHLVFRSMYHDLVREVELSAQYEEHYGWMVLAPRWKRQIGMKRKTLTLAEIEAMAQQIKAQAQNMAQQPAAGELDPTLLQLATLPEMVADPMAEDAAAELLMHWYDRYIQNNLPEDMRDRVPMVKKTTAVRAVQDLRATGTAKVPIPYLAVNGPEISALKPWDEVFIAPEMTSEHEIVFQVERVYPADLKGRIISEGYDSDWVDKAIKLKGSTYTAPTEVRSSPVGLDGLLGGNAGSVLFSSQPVVDSDLVEIIHAVYRAVDDDGVPTICCTTFHRMISDGSYAKHETDVDGYGDKLPYCAGVREWWCRAITSSRGVPERAHTTQNIVKGLFDSLIDRSNMTAVPPVNVYESPTGVKYRFGPAVQNFVRQGREPKFMDGPTGTGMSEAVEVLEMVNKMKDNSYGLMSESVPPARVQMAQAMSIQRFLMTWNSAFEQIVALCRRHMDDADFAEITGAPAGWLDAHRDDDDSLDASLMFDVRELDPDLMMKRIEAMNNIAIPNDVLGTINRAEWAGDMVRSIMGPLAARRLVTPTADASQALHDKASLEVLKMFAGNQPNFVDKDDPTAAGLLNAVGQIVMANPTYLRALTDEALAAVAGQNAPMVAQQLGQRNPDPNFSQMLIKYLDNLKFIGVTQQQNKQIGRIGVNPQMQAQ